MSGGRRPGATATPSPPVRPPGSSRGRRSSMPAGPEREVGVLRARYQRRSRRGAGWEPSASPYAVPGRDDGTVTGQLRVAGPAAARRAGRRAGPVIQSHSCAGVTSSPARAAQHRVLLGVLAVGVERGAGRVRLHGPGRRRATGSSSGSAADREPRPGRAAAGTSRPSRASARVERVRARSAGRRGRPAMPRCAR